MAVNGRENDGVPIVDARIAALYREVATEEPSARLDEAIAREARGTRPVATAGPPLMERMLPWRLPLVTAAVVVVSASVVVLMLDRDAYYTGVGENGQSQSAAPARGNGEPRAKHESGASSERQGDLPPIAADKRATGEPRGTGALEQSRRPAGGQAISRDVPLPPPPAEAVADAPPTSPPPAAAAAAAGEPRRSRAEKALSSPRADSMSQAEAASALVAELDKQPPERWIERIETLRREGRRAEADALLREFTRRFGDAAVPAALKSP